MGAFVKCSQQYSPPIPGLLYSPQRANSSVVIDADDGSERRVISLSISSLDRRKRDSQLAELRSLDQSGASTNSLRGSVEVVTATTESGLGTFYCRGAKVA